MKREDIQTVKNLEAVITSAERNIDNYKYHGESKELKIWTNDEGREPRPFFISGKTKDKIIEILKQEQQQFLDEKLAELEKI